MALFYNSIIVSKLFIKYYKLINSFFFATEKYLRINFRTPVCMIGTLFYWILHFEKEYHSFLVITTIPVLVHLQNFWYIHTYNLVLQSKNIYQHNCDILVSAPYNKALCLLEIWLIIPLFPVGVLLGWGEKM